MSHDYRPQIPVSDNYVMLLQDGDYIMTWKSDRPKHIATIHISRTRWDGYDLVLTGIAMTHGIEDARIHINTDRARRFNDAYTKARDEYLAEINFDHDDDGEVMAEYREFLCKTQRELTEKFSLPEDFYLHHDNYCTNHLDTSNV